MLKVRFGRQFKKDLDKIHRRNLSQSKLDVVVLMLAKGEKLPSKYRDHALEISRNYKNVRECHIAPDWLLVYQIDDQNLDLILIRIGTHSDLF